MTTILTILIFIISLFKSIFDLLINPLVFKKQKTSIEMIDAAKKKRDRGDKSTALVFIIVAIASGINLRESVMTQTVSIEKHQALEQRVQELEEFIFPDSGGGNTSTNINAIISKIDDLEARVTSLTVSAASKNDLDKAIEILSLLGEEVKALEISPSKAKTISVGH